VGKGLSPTSSPGILERPSAPGRCMSTRGSPPCVTDWLGPARRQWPRQLVPATTPRTDVISTHRGLHTDAQQEPSSSLLRITMRGGDWRVCMGSESLVEVPEGCLGNVGPRFAATVLFEESCSVDVGSRGRRCGAGQVQELQGPTCTHQSSGNAIAPPIGLNLWTRDDNE
jgi:hypothetical protein